MMALDQNLTIIISPEGMVVFPLRSAVSSDEWFEALAARTDALAQVAKLDKVKVHSFVGDFRL